MRAILLVNPAAGDGRAAKAVGAVAGYLRRVCEVDIRPTISAAATAEAAADAVADGVEVLAVLGGDGIAHTAVQACAGSDTALAVIPTGTGNDLARATGTPLNPVDAARVVAESIRHRRHRELDLGRIVGGGWFTTVLCAGFDSMVNARVNRMRLPRGKRRYDLAVARELMRMHPMPLRLETDTELLELEATLIALGNTATYGGGIAICPDADPCDGLLDVTVVGRVGRAELLRILPSLRTGRHVDHPAVRVLRARAVRIGGDNGWFAYADGEPQARLPLTVRCHPAALRLVG